MDTQHESIIPVPASQEHTLWFGHIDDLDDINCVGTVVAEPVFGYGESSHEPYVMHDGRIVCASQVDAEWTVMWEWASARVAAAIKNIPGGG